MQIIIDENWALGADRYSWHIKKSKMRAIKGKKGEKEKVYEAVKWYATAEQAIKGLADLRLRTSDCSTLADALEFNKNVLSSIVGALAPDIEVRVK